MWCCTFHHNPSSSFLHSSICTYAKLRKTIDYCQCNCRPDLNCASTIKIWTSGVVKPSANKASIYLNFIPVFASIFAVLFLGEQLHTFQIIGGLAVVAGVLLSSKK
ncbi:EamA family transporter [Lysinibacillus sp. NPDC097287]|uniref:EamA family transporter n=1 Tax=Lysinibacillus sp. NPDC097287 TaxID=3364144 RepID=UPI003821DEF3